MEESEQATTNASSGGSRDPPSVRCKRDEPEAVNTGCGWGRFRPAILAPFAHMWTFIVLYFVYSFTHGVNGSYSVAVLTTIERRFNLSSSLVGVATNMSFFGYVINVVVVSFSRKNRPRLFAVCMLLTSIGAFLYMLPHVVYGTGNDAFDTAHAQRPTLVNSTALMKSGSAAVQLCADSTASDGAAEAESTCSAAERKTGEEDVSVVMPAVVMIVIAELLHGIAGAPILTLGPVFIDDHTDPQLSAKLIGLMYTFRIMSPVASFAMGGYFLTVYANLKETNLTQQHPQWIGAWWLGFLITAIINFVIFIPTSMLPKNLRPIRKSSSSVAYTTEEGRESAEEEVRGKNRKEEEEETQNEKEVTEERDNSEEGEEKKKDENKKEDKQEEIEEVKAKGDKSEEDKNKEEKEEETQNEKEVTEERDNREEGEEKKKDEDKEEDKPEEIEEVKAKGDKSEENKNKEEKEEETLENRETSVVPLTTEKDSASEPEKTTDSFSADWKELPRVVMRLGRNPIYMLALTTICVDWSLLGCLMFLPKYVEVHFQKTASVAVLLAGLIPKLFAAVASYVGGVVSGKIKGIDGGVAGLCRMNFTLSVITLLLLVPAMFLSCPDVPYSGQVVNHRLNMTTDCNANCGCSSNAFDPVCGSDGLLYFSPCHAGCTQQANSTANPSDPSGRLVRSTECGCVAETEGNDEAGRGGVVFAGFCDNLCESLIPYLVTLIAIFIVSNLHKASDTGIILRCIRKEDKAFAMGFQFLCIASAIFLSILSNGFVFDATCIRRKTTSCTNSEGACLLYDRHALRLGYHGLAMAIKSLSAILYCVTYLLARRKRSLLTAQQKDAPKLTECA